MYSSPRAALSPLIQKQSMHLRCSTNTPALRDARTARTNQRRKSEVKARATTHRVSALALCMRKSFGLVLLAAALGLADQGFRTLSLFVGSKGESIAEKGEEPNRDCKMKRTCDVPGAFHSQAVQDKCVKAVFDGKRDGYFVDLAANHPIAKSNTRTLERDFGWRGLCIDGNEDFLMLLLKRRKCQVVGAIVSSDADAYVEYRKWHGSGGGGSTGTWHHALSGIVGYDNKRNITEGTNGAYAAGSQQKGAQTGFKDVQSVSTRLEDILRKHNAPSTIEYLSLDVEGAEEAVMRSFPFHSYTFQAVVRQRCPPALACLLLDRRDGCKNVCACRPRVDDRATEREAAGGHEDEQLHLCC